MIKVLRTDTIVDIISKMNNSDKEDLILSIPLGHPILHNHLSLKILKVRAGTKKLIIVTSDKVSRNIGKPLGIEYTLIKDQKFYDEKSVHGKLLSYNFTFSEYFIFSLKKYLESLKKLFLRNKSIEHYSIRYAKQKSRIGFFLLTFMASILLLLFIFYFAVTKTYVHISPEISVKSRSKNIIFQERETSAPSLNENLVPLTKISKIVSLSVKFGATGIDEEKLKRSSGLVTVVNELPEDVQLLPKTRFLGANGLTYETEEWIQIPAAADGQKGQVKAKLFSQIKDSNGVIVGKNANFSSGAVLSIPGLKANRDMIYAISTTDFTGADDYTEDKVLTKDDIENAKKILEQKLKSEALKELKNQIRAENNINNVTYDILGVDDIINYSNFSISGEDELEIGKTINTFELGGSINIETYIYNKESVLVKLKGVVNDSIIGGSEKLLTINDNSLRVSSELSRQKGPLEIKATMEVEALIVHDFGNNSDAYVQKLKGTIMGLTEEEAEKLLVNDSKISNAKVEITPFFVQKVPNISENIVFEIDNNL